MGDFVPSVRNFNKRLWLSGGRDQLPDGAMRRCVGAAPELTGSVRSRYGQTVLFPGLVALALNKYNGARYQHDGNRLLKNGVVVDGTGYNGQRPTFVKAPPAQGLPDYLFTLGAGKSVKIDPSGNITNWGIQPPLDGMQTQIVPQELITIDDFEAANIVAQWTSGVLSPVHCALTAETTQVYAGNQSLKIAPSVGPWSITKYLNVPLNLAVYNDGTISPQTDVISIWVNCKHPTTTIWLWIMFDVNDGSFKRDYYQATVQLVPTTANKHAADANVILTAPADAWFQVALPKSSFLRVGTNLYLDWQQVQAIRIQGGYLPPQTGPQGGEVFIDNFQMFGGAPLGTGPTALSGGSTFQYLVTFGSDITGNDSNPNSTPIIVSGVALQNVRLNSIPVSADPQVTNRKLWRTSEGGALFFFLDRIGDNLTTTYLDNITTTPLSKITTPWQKNVTVPAQHYIDEGNGYYAFTVAGGTSGPNVPAWNIPTATWASVATFFMNETVLPRKALSNCAFRALNNGISGIAEPNWTTAPGPGGIIIDGQITWLNIGPLFTTDGLILWVTQGLNSYQLLGTQQVRYDNIPFPTTAGDAVYFQGSMYVTRDSNPGNRGYVYISPPGRDEGYGVVLNVGTDDDPSQKLVIWDEVVWLFTQNYIYPLTGVYPNIAVGSAVQGALGCGTNPFTVKDTPIGIVYQSAEDIRIFSRARNEALSFEALAPIERGAAVEDMNAFTATIVEHTKDEIWFSDGTVIIAYNIRGDNWRVVAHYSCFALFYEDDTGIIQASILGNVVSAEQPGVFLDNGQPIPISWQTPSILMDSTDQTLVKRIWIDINLNGQVLTPTLLRDEDEIVMPNITSTGRKRIPIPFQRAGKLLGVRLSGGVSAQIEWFGIWPELRNGKNQSA